MAPLCQFCMIAAYKYQHSYVKPVCFDICHSTTAVHRPDNIDGYYILKMYFLLIVWLLYVKIVK